MIPAYFDDLTVNNLYNEINFPYAVSNDINIIKHQLIESGFVPKLLSDFEEKGIYNISVGVSRAWSKINDTDKHVLDFISKDALYLAKQGKLKIFLNGQGEGWPMVYDKCDGYDRIHKVMQKLGLPKFSVIVGDANLFFEQDYHKWCCENNQSPMIRHCYFLTCFYYFDNKFPEYPLCLDAIKNEESKDFNSLNRTNRTHRIEHLYRLIKNKEYQKGLVSGHLPKDFKFVPMFHNVTYKNIKTTLDEVGPLTVDGKWFNVNPDGDDTAIFNLNIYKNSLLSVITESSYFYSGMFITEKAFKPIAAGHPFMILGQPGILKCFRDLGYKTNFYGIDQSYDEIIDPITRFYQFHLSLTKWISLSRDVKIENIKRSKDLIEHNFNLLQSKNYVQESYNRLKKLCFF